LPVDVSTQAGVYTTTRTVGGASGLLLWERHIARLSESLQLLAANSPKLFPLYRQDLDVKQLVQPSIRLGLAEALHRRQAGEEVALSAILCGRESTEADPVHNIHSPLLLGG
jgi:branched-subunit amino acid aminotransferase/4-amino-4-deoxychorismate lyase